MRKSLPFLVAGAIALAFTLPTAFVAPASADDINQAELKCLAETLYFEARGEPTSGQKAVAEVILNRVDSRGFPSTICGVVTQGSKNGCQFSYNCGGKRRAIHEKGAYKRVLTVAKAALTGAPRDLTDGALYFHTPAVKPAWSKRFTRTARIGHHIFYRPGDARQIASN